jgi:hypothetical protein
MAHRLSPGELPQLEAFDDDHHTVIKDTAPSPPFGSAIHQKTEKQGHRDMKYRYHALINGLGDYQESPGRKQADNRFLGWG